MFVVFSYIQRDFSTAISSKDVEGFYRAIWRFIGIVIVATPLFATYHYVQVPSLCPIVCTFQVVEQVH